MTHTEYMIAGVLALVIGLAIAATGTLAAMPIVLADRSLPGLRAGQTDIGGLPTNSLASALASYDEQLQNKTVTLTLRDQTQQLSLAELGISLDVEATASQARRRYILDLLTGNLEVEPVLKLDEDTLRVSLLEAFADVIAAPEDANLAFNPAGQLILVPSQAGEQVDASALFDKISLAAGQNRLNDTFMLAIHTVSPRVTDEEVEGARVFASQLLNEGLKLTFQDQEIIMNAYTLRRLMRFEPQPDPANPSNYILGVTFEPQELITYLETTIAPDINQSAQNARFSISAAELANSQPRVDQFALPREGRQLNIPATVSSLTSSLNTRRAEAALIVDVTQPDIASTADIERLGITKLLSVGQSDYAGSPGNRVHNIAVGANRYHGALIPPGEEFSFNELLGPVNAAAGFKPELVIKNNVTTPEYGGGLCQVSTTIFRAALNAGLEITARRNHSYAVRYYGTPGLDATIYPPYTDLRFRNNTPAHILVQSRIEGTKLYFEFWGTDDGRQVEVSGPVTYDKQPDGAVKAYVNQSVLRNGEEIIDDTFYSNYKSPNLFPRARSENGET